MTNFERNILNGAVKAVRTLRNIRAMWFHQVLSKRRRWMILLTCYLLSTPHLQHTHSQNPPLFKHPPWRYEVRESQTCLTIAISWSAGEKFQFLGPTSGDLDLRSLQESPRFSQAPGGRQVWETRWWVIVYSCKWACFSGSLGPSSVTSLSPAPRSILNWAPPRWQPALTYICRKAFEKDKNVTFVPWW